MAQTHPAALASVRGRLISGIVWWLVIAGVGAYRLYASGSTGDGRTWAALMAVVGVAMALRRLITLIRQGRAVADEPVARQVDPVEYRPAVETDYARLGPDASLYAGVREELAAAGFATLGAIVRGPNPGTLVELMLGDGGRSLAQFEVSGHARPTVAVTTELAAGGFVETPGPLTAATVEGHRGHLRGGVVVIRTLDEAVAMLYRRARTVPAANDAPVV